MKPFLRISSADKKAAMERALAAVKPAPYKTKRLNWQEKGMKVHAVKSAVKGGRS